MILQYFQSIWNENVDIFMNQVTRNIQQFQQNQGENLIFEYGYAQYFENAPLQKNQSILNERSSFRVL